MIKLKLFYSFLILISVVGISGCTDDGGFEPAGDLNPVISVNRPTGSSTVYNANKDFTFDIFFSDDNGLASFSLQSSELEININVSVDGERFYSYQETVSVTSDFGAFPISVRATDNAGNTSSATITLTKEEVLSETIYVVGDVAWNEWEPTQAMPMTPDEENEGWHELTLYSDGDDDGVKFIGQLDWAPNNWGLIDTDDPSQGMINDDSSEKILLEAGYSIVRFNPSSLEYTVEHIEEALPAPNGQFYVMGCGFLDTNGSAFDLCWNLDHSPIPMEQDAKNPYLHRLTVQFSDATDLKFNGNHNWDELDWGFPEAFEDDPETDFHEHKVAPDGDVLFTETGRSYGADWKFLNRPGTYELIVDEYAGMAQIRKIN